MLTSAQYKEIKNLNTHITFGVTMMTSGIIMSQSTVQGHRVGIPCFMIGISIFAIAKERKQKLKKKHENSRF